MDSVQIAKTVEPRVGVEPTTCRLRNGLFSSIPFVFFPDYSLLVPAFRYLSPSDYATHCATVVAFQGVE